MHGAYFGELVIDADCDCHGPEAGGGDFGEAARMQEEGHGCEVLDVVVSGGCVQCLVMEGCVLGDVLNASLLARSEALQHPA